MAAYVALLRGVNVGGKNMLPMKDLCAMFTGAGCSEVATYIQSGNVVFVAREALARRVPGLIAGKIDERFALRIPIVTRTADELAEVVRRNPFLRAGADTKMLHVAFLESAPGKAEVASLDPDRSPPDVFAVRGREVYLHLRNGAGRTKLTNDYLEKKLGTTSTLRNWATVLKLAELAKVRSPARRA
jgi:uncharacterized protein (DUF1697 family)